MRVLWVINQCIPVIAKHLNIEVPNKEGWLTGLSEKILEDKNNGIELGVCFNTDREHSTYQGEFEVKAYGYNDEYEKAWEYDTHLTEYLDGIIKDFKPDVIHIFGT